MEKPEVATVPAVGSQVERRVGRLEPERSTRRPSNPWRLTDGQALVMDAICEHGCQKTAADKLGLSIKTVQSHTFEAALKMGYRTGLAKYLAWDRWRRSKTPNARLTGLP